MTLHAYRLNDLTNQDDDDENQDEDFRIIDLDQKLLNDADLTIIKQELDGQNVKFTPVILKTKDKTWYSEIFVAGLI